MKITGIIKKIFGPKCTAININGESESLINIPSLKITLCEAVNQSFKVPIRLNIEKIDCMGAKRSIGFINNDEYIINEISRHSNLSDNYIRSALQTIPALTGIKHLNMGLTEYMENDMQPDLFIMYVQPFKITDLMYNLAKLEIRPSISPYSFLSVCGNVFANCYLNQVVSISFGCPESRKRGGIGKNEIVVGLPFKIVSELLQVYEYEKG